MSERYEDGTQLLQEGHKAFTSRDQLLQSYILEINHIRSNLHLSCAVLMEVKDSKRQNEAVL